MKYNSDKFNSIREALRNDTASSGNGLFGEILKPKIGNTYTLRLLPQKEDGKTPWFEYEQHSWDSLKTGEFISVLSLRTFKQTDPIASELYRIKKKGTEEEQEKAKLIKWARNGYVNVYVVEDPVNPENNGKVKILRAGKKVMDKFKSAVDGDDAEEYGAKVFDLSKAGVNFKLKVEKVVVNGTPMNNYDNSRFTSPVDLGLSEERCNEIYDSVFDVTSIQPVKTEEELKTLWNEHYLCSGVKTAPVKTAPAKKAEKKEVVKSTDNEVDSDLSEEEVDELLRSTTASDVE
jgi:hypothetical protein